MKIIKEFSDSYEVEMSKDEFCRIMYNKAEEEMTDDMPGVGEEFEIKAIGFPYVIKLGKDEKGIMSTMTFFTAKDIESDTIYHRNIIDEQRKRIKELEEKAQKESESEKNCMNCDAMKMGYTSGICDIYYCKDFYCNHWREKE